MACQIYRPALIGLLEQFASVQGSFRDQSVVILLGESSRSTESARDDADCLELCSRIADSVFIDCERLGKELIAELLEAGLIGNLTTHYEQPKSKIGTAGVHPLVEVTNTLVHEPVQSRRLALPVVIEMLPGFQLAS